MASTDSAATGFSTDLPPELVADEQKAAAGTGPWRIALRRLRRNKVALAFGVLFILLCLTAVLAPVFADHIAHNDPYRNNITGTVMVGGKVCLRHKAVCSLRVLRRVGHSHFIPSSNRETGRARVLRTSCVTIWNPEGDCSPLLHGSFDPVNFSYEITRPSSTRNLPEPSFRKVPNAGCRRTARAISGPGILP